MPSFWDYIHIGRPTDEHAHRNLQEGLFQIASQTCSILVQVNNTNNISYGGNATNVQYNNFRSHGDSADNAASFHSDNGQEGEQRVVLLPSSSLASLRCQSHRSEDRVGVGVLESYLLIISTVYR